jgi:glycerophosphoryl diester phosphodiesterase
MISFNSLKPKFLLFFMAVGAMTMVAPTANATDVISHRGFWKTEGSAQNSCTSLKKAIEIKCWGSETDIWMTTDGHLMVNHDPKRDGVTFQTSTYKQCKNLKLENGEKISQLKDFLKIMKKSVKQGNHTKLIIEVKPHATKEQNYAAANEAVKEVAKYGVKDFVEYISFNLDACDAIVKADPTAKIAYLMGDLTPQQCKDRHYTGIDYEQRFFRRNPELVKQSHDLGLTVNVWTVNKQEDMEYETKLGVDFITTNEPLMAKEVCGKE